MREKLSNLLVTLVSVLLTSLATVLITISFAVPKISVNYGRVTKQVDIITENVNKLMLYNQNLEALNNEVSTLRLEQGELKKSYKELDQLLGSVIILAREAKNESERATRSNIDFANKLESVNNKIDMFGTSLAVLSTDVKYICKEIDSFKGMRKD